MCLWFPQPLLPMTRSGLLSLRIFLRPLSLFGSWAENTASLQVLAVLESSVCLLYAKSPVVSGLWTEGFVCLPLFNNPREGRHLVWCGIQTVVYIQEKLPSHWWVPHWMAGRRETSEWQTPRSSHLISWPRSCSQKAQLVDSHPGSLSQQENAFSPISQCSIRGHGCILWSLWFIFVCLFITGAGGRTSAPCILDRCSNHCATSSIPATILNIYKRVKYETTQATYSGDLRQFVNLDVWLYTSLI